jgi:structural maintenance of chromosome 3 (chondroitin sulfate proteoglycan 6)
LLFKGIDSIKSIIKQWESEPQNKELCKGYHGLLIDNIRCDKAFYTAVESSISNRLFYHIVENDTIAMRLLKQMNQQKLHGEVNYLPLNVLRIENDDSRRPPSNISDALPLIDRVEYEKKVEKAVLHVFDRILLCRTAEVATQLAKETRMDCVLLDGDLVSRKGALTGGYVDTRQSKLQYYKQRNELHQQIRIKEQEIANLQQEIHKIDSQLNSILNDLQKHEAKSKRTRDLYEQMKLDLNSRKNEIDRFERSKPDKEASLRSLNSDIEQLKAKKSMYEEELGK